MLNGTKKWSLRKHVSCPEVKCSGISVKNYTNCIENIRNWCTLNNYKVVSLIRNYFCIKNTNNNIRSFRSPGETTQFSFTVVQVAFLEEYHSIPAPSHVSTACSSFRVMRGYRINLINILRDFMSPEIDFKYFKYFNV